MKKTYLLGLMLVILLPSCSRKDEQIEISAVLQHKFDIQAELPSVEQDNQTKGYLGSFVSANWSKGDEVSVVNLTKGSVLGGTLSANSNGNTSSFSGTVTGKIERNDALALLYPSLKNAQEQQFSPFNFDISSQSATSQVKLLAYSTFTASEVTGSFAGLSLRFQYLLSYLKLNMNNLPPYSSVEKVVIKNVPSSMTVSINDTKNGFTAGTNDERKGLSRITVSGDNHISQNGTLYIPLAVMPSDSCSYRTVVVTVANNGNFSTPFTDASFSDNNYYNTIVGNFEQITTAESSEYGAYLMDGTVLDTYDIRYDELTCGTEGSEKDFTIFNPTESAYWTLKGIPSDAGEQDVFTARFYSYGIPGIRTQNLPDAKIVQVEKEGQSTKMWIKAENYLFVVRK